MTQPFAPTPEQANAVELFGSGQSLAIEAGAGTGKTSTLLLLAEAMPAGKRGQYVAFNKAIVTEASAKFPKHVACNTAHSLAFRSIGRSFSHRLNSPRMRSDEIARRLGIDPITVRVAGEEKRLAPGFLAGHVMRACTRFCQSADLLPEERHFEYIDGIDTTDPDGSRRWDNNRQVRRALMPAVRKAWADLSSPEGQLPYAHDCYLKAWHLSGPEIPADVIFFDEAQDANPVLLAIVAAQTHAQLVFVGDSCQPPGTLVSVVVDGGAGGRASRIEQRPIEQIQAGDRVVSYDIAQAHLHRRGRPVTGISSRPFSGNLVVVKSEGRASRYTPDHRCVVRISDAFVGRHVVYMMRRAGQYRIGRASGSYSGTLGPMARAKSEKADGLWLLDSFGTAAEAAAAEVTMAWRFGVPTLTFEHHGRGVITPAALEAFWASVGDNSLAASAALAASGRDLRWPLWEAWTGSLLVRRTIVTRACNLMAGMRVLPADADALAYGKSMGSAWWTPVEVEREHYTGPVFSMDVADHHTYVADGLVTHNCQQIYEFTGAVNALAQVPADLRAFLTQSFRFGPAVASEANRILGKLEADLRIQGFEKIASVVGPCAAPKAILTRTNAKAVETVLTAQREGRRVHLVGGGGEVAGFARAALELREKGRTGYPNLACFSSWGEVQEYVENDPQGSDLKLLVKLVDDYGAEQIIACLDRMIPERDAQLVVSTAHKSKGREWESVQLASDFAEPKGDTELSQAELRLLYVAATRARLHLDVSLAGAFDALTAPAPAAEPAAERQWFDTATGEPIEAPAR